MKHLFTSILFGLWLVTTPLFAQERAKKVYVAEVSSGTLPPKELKRRNDEIKFQATNKIRSNLLDLLNTLTADSLEDSERNAIIQNSFLPNSNQVFYGDDVVIEDDIDPTHISAENSVDVPVERYLRNLDLFYAKSGSFTIKFTQLVVSEVQEGKDYPYIKVFFTSTFGGKHSQIDKSYRPVNRVAELRAERVDGKWRTFITRLAFLRPGEALTQLSKPVIARGFAPKQPIDGQEVLFKKVENSVDSIAVKWDRLWLNVVRSSVETLPIGYYQRRELTGKSQNQVSITLSNDDDELVFRRVDGSTLLFRRTVTAGPCPDERFKRLRRSAWLKIATGVIALGASYAGYSYLQNNYKEYKATLANLNAEYEVWKGLSQQSGGTRTELMPFNSYASPGIYAVYGGGALGTGSLFSGVLTLIKANKAKCK